MTFKYVWGVIESKEERPPSGARFSALKNGYKFYPFPHEGDILTFDEMIWNAKHIIEKTEKQTNRTLGPSAGQLEEIIRDATPSPPFCMIAFSDTKAPIFVGHLREKIHELPQHLRRGFMKKFIDCGYDVVDATGLSALTNCGYLPEELPRFDDIPLTINHYGLVTHEDGAVKLADLASRLVPEHGIFLPVNVWANLHT